MLYHEDNPYNIASRKEKFHRKKMEKYARVCAKFEKGMTNFLENEYDEDTVDLFD